DRRAVRLHLSPVYERCAPMSLIDKRTSSATVCDEDIAQPVSTRHESIQSAQPESSHAWPNDTPPRTRINQRSCEHSSVIAVSELGKAARQSQPHDRRNLANFRRTRRGNARCEENTVRSFQAHPQRRQEDVWSQPNRAAASIPDRADDPDRRVRSVRSV